MSASSPTTTFSDIEAAECALQNARVSYLKRWGWSQTCNTPGSYWLWRRDFADSDAKRLQWWEETSARMRDEGRQPPSKPQPMGIITAPTELAVSMTVKSMDEQLKLADDEDAEG